MLIRYFTQAKTAESTSQRITLITFKGRPIGEWSYLADGTDYTKLDAYSLRTFHDSSAGGWSSTTCRGSASVNI